MLALIIFKTQFCTYFGDILHSTKQYTIANSFFNKKVRSIDFPTGESDSPPNILTRENIKKKNIFKSSNSLTKNMKKGGNTLQVSFFIAFTSFFLNFVTDNWRCYFAILPPPPPISTSLIYKNRKLLTNLCRNRSSTSWRVITVARLPHPHTKSSS